MQQFHFAMRGIMEHPTLESDVHTHQGTGKKKGFGKTSVNRSFGNCYQRITSYAPAINGRVILGLKGLKIAHPSTRDPKAYDRGNDESKSTGEY